MNDALEILDELDEILNSYVDAEEIIAIITNYVEQKRLEFQPSKGECAS